MKLTDERIKELLRNERKLNTLEDNGVGRWEDYNVAIEKFEVVERYESKINDLIDDIEEIYLDCYYGVDGGISFIDESKVKVRELLESNIITFIFKDK